jgi:hypothetical protein
MKSLRRPSPAELSQMSPAEKDALIGTIQTWIGPAATALNGAYEASRRAILAADVAHLDESGVRVDGHILWLHVAGTVEHAFYTIHPKRGREAMTAAGLLPEFTGCAIHDHWAPYFGFDRATHALCNAHLLRELRYFEAATDGHRWPIKLREILVDAKKAVEAARAAGHSAVDPGQRAHLLARYDQWVAWGLLIFPEIPKEPGRKGRPKQEPATNLLRRLQDFKADILRCGPSSADAESYRIPEARLSNWSRWRPRPFIGAGWASSRPASHRVLLDQVLFFLGVALDRRGNRAGIDDLPAPGEMAVPGQFAPHGGEDGLGGACLLAAFAEGPEGSPVGNLATAAKPCEALKAEPVEQLELQLLVAEVVRLLEEQRPHHDLGGERRAATLGGARAGCGQIDLGGERGKVDMLVQQLQHVAQLIELGFAFFGGKQAFFEHGGSTSEGQWRYSLTRAGFSRFPLESIRQKFGPARTVSKSALSRYWRKHKARLLVPAAETR